MTSTVCPRSVIFHANPQHDHDHPPMPKGPPRAVSEDTMTPLTQLMRDALTVACRPEGLRRPRHPDQPGCDPWPYPAQTIRALERRGFVTTHTLRHRKGHMIDIWRTSDEGRLALFPPARVRPDRPGWFRGPWDPGTVDGQMRRAPEPEPVHVVDPEWERQGRERWEAAQDRRRVAAELAGRVRAA